MEEAARLLGIHPQTLRAWDVQGKIRVVRTPGGKRRVPESEIRRLQGERVTSCLSHSLGSVLASPRRLWQWTRLTCFPVGGALNAAPVYPFPIAPSGTENAGMVLHIL